MIPGRPRDGLCDRSTACSQAPQTAHPRRSCPLTAPSTPRPPSAALHGAVRQPIDGLADRGQKLAVAAKTHLLRAGRASQAPPVLRQRDNTIERFPVCLCVDMQPSQRPHRRASLALLLRPPKEALLLLLLDLGHVGARRSGLVARLDRRYGRHRAEAGRARQRAGR